MNHLLRSSAPVSEKGWQEIDTEVRERLEPALGARRLVDFVGPLGWEHSATNLGRIRGLESAPAARVTGSVREVLPLIELRADFTVARDELRAIDRGADDADLASLDAAAHELAKAENATVLSGWPNAIEGVAARVSHEPLALGSDPDGYLAVVAEALTELRRSGVGGPYGLALGPEPYQLAARTAEGRGTLLADQLPKVLDGGPVVWTPGITGGVVISLRGGDFVLECGQDLSVGYDFHDAEEVHLYIQESLSFRVATPEAAVALTA